LGVSRFFCDAGEVFPLSLAVFTPPAPEVAVFFQYLALFRAAMLRKLQSLGFAILALMALPFIVWVISGSSEFQSCFHDQEHSNTYKALYESNNDILKSVLRVRLNSGCVLSNYGGAITAIATVFIALYTYTLSDSTRALRDSAIQQRMDLVESSSIPSFSSEAESLGEGCVLA
jgi:hypothetical protein